MAEAATRGANQNRATVAAQTAISTAAALVSYQKPERVFLRVQNTGTTIIYLNMNDTAPTSSVYHAAIAGGSVANDGTGGVFSVDMWGGPIMAISSAIGGLMVITEVLAPPSWE